MKAIVVEKPGAPENLVLHDVPDPELKPGHVIVDVTAAALNRADLLQRRGMYPPPKGETDIMGLECAGVVSRVADGITGVRVGDRVMALLPGGGYAERVSIHEHMAIPIPESLSFDEAAAIPEAFLTAREALFTLGRVDRGATVLIHAAAGGIGSAAVQLAHEAGATVVATAGSKRKLQRVQALGADTLVDYTQENFAEVVQRATQGNGADVVLDFIGGSYWPKHEQCLAEGGRCIVIGVLGGVKAEVNFAIVLRRRLQILGLVMRSRSLADKISITRDFVSESLPAIASGRLKAIVDKTFPLAQAGKAHAYMEENQNVGKIVLRVRAT